MDGSLLTALANVDTGRLLWNVLPMRATVRLSGTCRALHAARPRRVAKWSRAWEKAHMYHASSFSAPIAAVETTVYAPAVLLAAGLAFGGEVRLLATHLRNHRSVFRKSPARTPVIENAVRGGHVATLAFLSVVRFFGTRPCSPASIGWRVPVNKIGSRRCSAQDDPFLLHIAVCNNCLGAVKWLRNCGVPFCADELVVLAGVLGHQEIVEWIAATCTGGIGAACVGPTAIVTARKRCARVPRPTKRLKP